jgi:pilus assembly protein TadC
VTYSLLTAVAAGCAVAAWPRPRAAGRQPPAAPPLVPPTAPAPPATPAGTPPATRLAALLRAPAFAATAAALAGLAVAGPRTGPLLAAALAAGTFRLARALPTRAAADRDRACAAVVPLLADLVGACLAAGTTLDAALDAAALATPGPLADEIAAAVRSVRLGVPSRVAWAPLLDPDRPPPVRALGRALARSADSGSAPAALLRALADDARTAARTAGDLAARRAAVLAVLPLGLCFLPAFVLLGIVPLVAGLLRAVVG